MDILVSNLINQIIQNHPKYGPIRLLGTDSKDGKLHRSTKCDIIFENTGYKTTVSYEAIIKNCARDRLFPDILGIGCIGYASNKDDPPKYQLWSGMIHKCYNPNNPYYKSFGALGYFVNPRWHRFDYFLEDIRKYPKPECDPDIQIQFKIKPELVAAGCREFSFENCGFFANELDIKFGEIYNSTNCGDYIPLEYTVNNYGYKAVRIKFVLTGYETIVKPVYVISGEITDPYFPRICGVGWCGEISTLDKKREYGIWTKMLSRCYNPNVDSYKYYGAVGVRVCERWHSFVNFYEDLKSLPNYDKWVLNQVPYHLDKDYLQQNVPLCQRIYSPQTCCFLPSVENIALSNIELHNRSNREYYGVETTKANNYTVIIRNDNFGTYSNIEAAANARDWRVKWFGMSTPLNFQQPTMKPSEWLSYRVGAKSMMNIVGPMKDPWEK